MKQPVKNGGLQQGEEGFFPRRPQQPSQET